MTLFQFDVLYWSLYAIFALFFGRLFYARRDPRNWENLLLASVFVGLFWQLYVVYLVGYGIVKVIFSIADGVASVFKKG